MGENIFEISNLQAFIGNAKVAFAESCNVELDKDEEGEQGNINLPQSWECTSEVVIDKPLVPGMLTYNDLPPVHIRIEHIPKRVPRKIKKARKSFWRGKQIQVKAYHWYNRNYYVTSGMGTMTVDAEGNGTIEGSGQWQDSRHPNEMVMSHEAMERLTVIMKRY